MPKDRRVRSSSFDQAMVSPCSCNSKMSDGKNSSSSSPCAGDEKEWGEARCPICMEHPHNAVLLLCTSHKKGCRPFLCDTSYRHSNCLDQFRKSAAASSLQTPSQQCELVCPFCRGPVTGWDVIQPARKFMNSKTRSCSLDTCDFIGNYAALRKHARLQHPSERPSEASPTRQSDWMRFEQQRDLEDALAHQSDDEYGFDGWPTWDEWVDDDFWSDGSFFNFQSGMLDIGDQSIDEIFSGLSLSFVSSYPTSPDEEMMDSGNSRSSDIHQWTSLSTYSNSRSHNHVASTFHVSMSRSSHHSDDGAAISRSRVGYHRDNDSTYLRPISSVHSENGTTDISSRSGYNRENGSRNLRSNGGHRSANLSTRSDYHRQTASTSFSTRSGHVRVNVSTVHRSRSNYQSRNAHASSRTRSSYQTRNAPTRSRTRSGYHREDAWHGSRVRSSPPVRSSRLAGSSRLPPPNYQHRGGG